MLNHTEFVFTINCMSDSIHLLLVLHHQQNARQEWYGLAEQRLLSSLLQGGALRKSRAHWLEFHMGDTEGRGKSSHCCLCYKDQPWTSFPNKRVAINCMILLDGIRLGGIVAEWSARRTRNLVVPGLSPALATCWICSRSSRAQILGHACK